VHNEQIWTGISKMFNFVCVVGRFQVSSKVNAIMMKNAKNIPDEITKGYK
jgi:hypothetical protein